MTCYFPLDAWQHPTGGSPVFKYRYGFSKLTLPCGQCTGCRLERSRQWAMRCVHEASLHDSNSFITLTYSDNPVSLRKSDFQKFMKRFRKAISPSKILYFMCGEYGEENSRPHFHACIFGYGFPDRELLQDRDGVKLFRSSFLESLWPHGFSTIGEVTFESAAYVARYTMKKVKISDLSPEELKDYYSSVLLDTGEIIDRLPEYADMSRRPAIAFDWYAQFKRDLEKDFLTLRGVKMRPPRAYDKLLHVENPDVYLSVKESRKAKALLHASDQSPARLDVKRSIKERKLTKLERFKI